MTAPEPFRVAFILAAMTAIRAVSPGFGPEYADPSIHVDELVFGFFSVQLFGFLTIAQPRWVGHPLGPCTGIWAYLLAEIACFLWGFFDLATAAEARNLVGLFGVVLILANTPPGKTAATFPVVLLAALHLLVGAIGHRLAWAGTDMAGLAVIVLICLEVSNRVGAALIVVARERAGRPPLATPPKWIHIVERIASAIALALWGLGINAGPAAAVATLAGGLWLAALRPWEIRPYAGVAILVVGMVWKRVAFAALAINDLGIAEVPSFFVIHAFAIGGLATLAIGVATSLTRKRDGKALARSPLADFTYGAIALAALLRTGAAIFPSRHEPLILTARIAWIVAFAAYALFVARRALAKPVIKPKATAGIDAQSRAPSPTSKA